MQQAQKEALESKEPWVYKLCALGQVAGPL